MKVALMIVYNHRYDKNIEKIESLLKEKFSYIYHIIPFYDGTKENVIPVYESSYFFSGYIAQAYEKIKNQNFTHFIFTADDIIINPIINENNFLEKIGLKDNESFIPKFIEFGTKNKGIWPRIGDAIKYNPYNISSGAEIKTILPNYYIAKDCFKQYGLNKSFSIPFIKALRNLMGTHTIYHSYIYTLMSTFIKLIKHPFSEYKLNYPLVDSYSDFFITTADIMPKFCQYCGAFAATNLFVEIAIPTALVLAAPNIKTEKETKLKGKAFWDKEIEQQCQKYHYKLEELLNNFPTEQIYHHPVKLSKWK